MRVLPLKAGDLTLQETEACFHFSYVDAQFIDGAANMPEMLQNQIICVAAHTDTVT